MIATKAEYIDRLEANVPFALKSRNQWVLYRLAPKPNGKMDKVPYNAHTDEKASSTDGKTWAPFDLAVEAYQAGHGDGLGYVFSADDPFSGVDFDACVTAGIIDTDKWGYVRRLNTYSEFSQSETGIHSIAEGTLPPGGRKSSQHGVEMYDSGRFFAFTGNHIEGTPTTIEHRQDGLAALHLQIFGKAPTEQEWRKAPPPANVPVDDLDLINLMLAGGRGDKIQRLLDGDTSAYKGADGKPDDSRADLALCNFLAFYTGGDAERMDRIFRQSKLYRPKWDRQDYRRRTIDKAINDTHNRYSGKGAKDMAETQAKIAGMSMNGSAPGANGHDGAAPVADDGKDEDARLLEWPVHDHGNASVVNALYPDAFGFCDGLGWMHNTGSYWDTENAEQAVNRAITETLIRRRIAAVKAERDDVVKGTSPSTSRKNATKDMVKDLVVVRLADFDTDPNLLNCANGVVDLRTGQLVAHGPSDRFTYCVPTAFMPAAQSELWLNFLAESVGDYGQIAEWLQMAFGYSITGRTNEECMFYAEGPTRSGKGTFARAKLALLGHPLATAVDFSTFTAARDGNSQNFDLAPLRAARVIVAAESGRYSSLNESVVKNITGNDPIRAAHKHKDFFTFEPQFKIWLSSNYPIKGDVDDDGFWGRIRVIRFPNSHLGYEDKTLKWRMAAKENLPGILAWAVEGSKRWYASPQGLITPKAVAAATQKARDELDHVQQWLDECTQPNIGGGETNAQLYKSYESWCEGNGHTPKKANAFGRSLEGKGYEACNVKVAGNSVRGRRNLLVVGNTSKDADAAK